MNFRRLDIQLDADPLKAALDRSPELWELDKFWKEHPVPIFRNVDTVYLRFPDKEVFRRGYGDVNTCFDQPALEVLPEARPVIDGLVSAVLGRKLGRVLINRLMPGDSVLPHSDGQNLYYSRYHVVLQTNDDVEFRCGEEKENMKPGECWWFDNSIEHEVINRGDTPRIHLIADIR